MAINDSGTRNQYTASASQAIFPYTFEIFNKNDIKVQQKVNLTGVTTTLTEGTHYTVSGVDNDAGGNVTLVTPAALNDVITLSRDMALERLTDFQNSGDFLAAEVNKENDREWAAIQQVDNKADLAIRPTINDTILNSTNTELAAPSVRAGKALGFTTTGALDYLSGTMPVGTFRNYSTLAALISDVANTTIGDTAYFEERSTGNGGGAFCKVVDATTVTENEFNIVTMDATRSAQIITEYDQIQANVLGGTLDNSTDNTAVVQAAIDLVGGTPDRGGKVKIPRYMNFNLKNLTFAKRCTLEYFLGDDVSATPSSTLNTNELVSFQANANNSGIVNEWRHSASFHPGVGVDVRQDVTGHDAYLGGGQSRIEPARASYNIYSEEIDMYRTVLEHYSSNSIFTGVKNHAWLRRITTTGIINTSFSTVPTKGIIITGTTSGAKGRLFSVDGTNLIMTWISGTFVVGETVSDDDETTTATIATIVISLLQAPALSVHAQEGVWTIGLPPSFVNVPKLFTVGGRIASQKTRTAGQYVAQTVNHPGYAWVDSYENATPAGIEIVYTTTPAAASRRLTLQNLDTAVDRGFVGAVGASTGFSNSALVATSSFNVSSIVRNSTGDYTINFTNAFARADYQVTFGRSNPMDSPYVFTKAVGSLRIRNATNGTTTLADLLALIDVTVVGGDI